MRSTPVGSVFSDFLSNILKKPCRDSSSKSRNGEIGNLRGAIPSYLEADKSRLTRKSVAVWATQTLFSLHGADSVKKGSLLDDLHIWQCRFHIWFVGYPSAAWGTRQRCPFGVCDLGRLLRAFGPLPLAHEVEFPAHGGAKGNRTELTTFLACLA